MDLTQLLEIIANLTKKNEYLKEQIKNIEMEASVFLVNFFKSNEKELIVEDVIEISVSNSIHSKDVMNSIKNNFDRYLNNEHYNFTDYKSNFLTIQTTSFSYLPTRRKSISIDKIDFNDNFFKSSTISKDTISVWNRL